MLSIGEFSNICRVSTKTLRYYAEIGLILPEEINSDNGYRYYSIKQLETMLLINRLKSYNFSLEEIKIVLDANELQDDILFQALTRKKNEMEKQLKESENTLSQLKEDMVSLKQGKSILSYLEDIEVQLVDVSMMYLLSIRKMVHKYELAEAYVACFGRLFENVYENKLTVLGPPMVLFHSDEFSPTGLDTEFAIPVKEYAKGTRDFCPGLCLKTVVHGSYSQLSSVYTKQREWADRKGYESSNALYELYVTDPSEVKTEMELITEVYYPVKRKVIKKDERDGVNHESR